MRRRELCPKVADRKMTHLEMIDAVLGIMWEALANMKTRRGELILLRHIFRRLYLAHWSAIKTSGSSYDRA